MLNFSKGFNNQQNVNTSKYSKMGRISPEEIIQKRYENNLKNINHPKKEEEKFKTVEQKNNGLDLYNKLNAYRNLNK